MTTIDLCIKNNHVLNVFSRLFEPNVLWINDGQIIATDKSSEQTCSDARGVVSDTA